MRPHSPGLVRLRGCLAGLFLALSFVPAHAQQTPTKQEPGPVMNKLAVEGSTVFSSEDVLWLLELTPGQQLPGPPEQVAQQLQKRYASDGYGGATVEAIFDPASGTLTLRVDEGRIDDIEFAGLSADLAKRFRRDLGVQSGDIYNRSVVQRSVNKLIVESQGGLEVAEDGIELQTRSGRRVLVIHIEEKHVRFRFRASSEAREDFFSPVDGFSPNVALGFTLFDPERFHNTLIAGHVSYKFARDYAGYSLGFQHRIVARPKIFFGAEIHDITASDDFWRLTSTEQSSVALGFRNTFRDYYQRKGQQGFVAVMPNQNQELTVSIRRDRHDSLSNTTDFSFFRDDQEFRPNPPIVGGSLRSVVIAYTFDSRGQLDRDPETTFTNHLLDDLYRANRRQAYGWRVDWTSEIAGHGLGGDYEFDRHILNGRAYVPLSPRQLLSGRMLLGFSGGDLPIERTFAIGGIGTVHGYQFKQAAGDGMALFNAQYRLDFGEGGRPERTSGFSLFAFFDAGRIVDPLPGQSRDWLKGTGFGVQAGIFRVEFGYRLDDIPKSLQVLVRLSPTF
jgi:outer membrane protein insertion porin family